MDDTATSDETALVAAFDRCNTLAHELRGAARTLTHKLDKRGAGHGSLEFALLMAQGLVAVAFEEEPATRLEDPVDGAVERPTEGGPQAPPIDPGLAAWRAAHRAGTPSRIDTDPELGAFVATRIGRRTFKELAADIAAAFPPERRVAMSSLHRWWHRNRERLGIIRDTGARPA